MHSPGRIKAGSQALALEKHRDRDCRTYVYGRITAGSAAAEAAHAIYRASIFRNSVANQQAMRLAKNAEQINFDRRRRKYT
jgi:hypothetical protein